MERAFFLLIISLVLVVAQELNQPCFLRSGGQGICKLGYDCPHVETQAKIGLTAKICGIYRFRRIIYCCPVNYNLQPHENSLLNVNNPFVFPTNDDPPRPVYKRKSEEKCAEYTRELSSTVHVAPLTTDGLVTSLNVANCSLDGVPLITGGTAAVAGEFPYMAALGFNSYGKIEWNCGGTLISDYYVVTAAHCINTSYYGSPVVVRLGEIDLTKNNDKTQYNDYNVANIIVHERYRSAYTYNDIALIRLASRVTFSEFIRPACLWSKFNLEENKTIATGWGKIGYADNLSDTLLKVSLFVYDNSLCRRTYRNDVTRLPDGIRNTMLCAGDLRGRRDTCQGDSGGPLVTTNKQNTCVYYVVGITSFGKACGIQNTPAVYTRVSEYIRWIENIVW